MAIRKLPARRLLASALVLVGLGLATYPHDARGSEMGGREAVMEADRRFAADVAAAEGAARALVWAGWFAPAGRQLVPGGAVTGREAIAEAMTPFFTDRDASLAWAPDQGGADGGLGWTSGRYVSRSAAGVSEGQYLTVWVKVDGEWRVEVDTGVPDPEPVSEPEPAPDPEPVE